MKVFVVRITTGLYLAALMTPHFAAAQGGHPVKPIKELIAELKSSTDTEKKNEFPYILSKAEPQTAQKISEVFVSTSNREGVSKTILPGSQNAPGALEGVLATDRKKHNWQADLIFFSDSFNDLPTLAISGPPQKKWLDTFILKFNTAGYQRKSRFPKVCRRGG